MWFDDFDVFDFQIEEPRHVPGMAQDWSMAPAHNNRSSGSEEVGTWLLSSRTVATICSVSILSHRT